MYSCTCKNEHIYSYTHIYIYVYPTSNYSTDPGVTEISPSLARWLDRPGSPDLVVLLRAEFGPSPRWATRTGSIGFPTQ